MSNGKNADALSPPRNSGIYIKQLKSSGFSPHRLSDQLEELPWGPKPMIEAGSKSNLTGRQLASAKN